MRQIHQTASSPEEVATTTRKSLEPASPLSPARPRCCFCFGSSPGLGRWPSLTHAHWLYAAFGSLSSQTSFFFFKKKEFPLVFPDTVHKRNSGVIVPKFPGPDQGQKLAVKLSNGDFKSSG